MLKSNLLYHSQSSLCYQKDIAFLLKQSTICVTNGLGDEEIAQVLMQHIPLIHGKAAGKWQQFESKLYIGDPWSNTKGFKESPLDSLLDHTKVPRKKGKCHISVVVLQMSVLTMLRWQSWCSIIYLFILIKGKSSWKSNQNAIKCH